MIDLGRPPVEYVSNDHCENDVGEENEGITERNLNVTSLAINASFKQNSPQRKHTCNNVNSRIRISRAFGMRVILAQVREWP